MEEILEKLKQEIKEIHNLESLKKVKAAYLGKKGCITKLLKNISTLSAEKRKNYGEKVNRLKREAEKIFSQKSESIKKEIENLSLEREKLDITLPGRRYAKGSLHPLSIVLREIEDIFEGLNFSIEEGPEIEYELYNFDMLNMPKEHPARDMHDTFYIDEGMLLRTHTSPVQIRVLKEKVPPLMFISPGKVYRRDADISHSPMFHQVEGMIVDKKLSFSHLKGIMTVFLRKFFGEETELRFRPSYFPFTEPSAEVDIQCIVCKGNGCRLCSYTGFLEILGCGVVHPNVFKAAGYDPEIWKGLAFGMGVERMAMLKYGIDDIRLFFENDYRFLKNFSLTAVT
ncbi:MAG: phenylalanine--tRNA ligase subunit alpha [Deltaproteobacteria bacterium]|nr:phenylalanine--tRNA ligase subunit alpha [Deltaproteobacteria bacterium]